MARKLQRRFHDPQPGGTGPTRLKLMAPDKPMLVPPVKV
jgi:hypothetical protein